MMSLYNLIENVSNKLFKTLEEALLQLKVIAFGVECITKTSKFSIARPFNLKALGGGRGVRHFTCRNVGNYTMYVSTGDPEEEEPIEPGETFSINSPHRIKDEAVKFRFADVVHPDYATEVNPQPNAIARYLVDIC
ncbi:MAG: hypothetical protein ACM31G_09730 [Flavobacteriales bacterium]